MTEPSPRKFQELLGLPLGIMHFLTIFGFRVKGLKLRWGVKTEVEGGLSPLSVSLSVCYASGLYRYYCTDQADFFWHTLSVAPCYAVI